MLVPLADVHNQLPYWLNKAAEGPVTITRAGKPVGVLIAPEECQHLRRVQAYLKILCLSTSLQERGLTADELQRASRQDLESRTWLHMRGRLV